MCNRSWVFQAIDIYISPLWSCVVMSGAADEVIASKQEWHLHAKCFGELRPFLACRDVRVEES